MSGADDWRQQSRESSRLREGTPEEHIPAAFDSSSVIDVTINRQPEDAYFNYNEESSLRRILEERGGKLHHHLSHLWNRTQQRISETREKARRHFGVHLRHRPQVYSTSEPLQPHTPSHYVGKLETTQLDDEDKDKEHQKADSSRSSHTTTETEPENMYQALQSCLDLRDKYMGLSRQRLGDNPRDYDGVFRGVDEDQHDVTGGPPVYNQDDHKQLSPNFKPWTIYPPPPPRQGKRDKEGNTVEIYATTKAPAGDDFEFINCDIPGEDTRMFELDSRGVYQVFEDLSDQERKPIFEVPTIREYYEDLNFIFDVISDGPTKSFAFSRLQYLRNSWDMYTLLNGHLEIAAMKKVPHRDFYNVRKVDTHIHHTSSMSEKHLLRFIKAKMHHASNDEVLVRDGAVLTLAEVFKALGITVYDLSHDMLDMHADDTFHRFDKFNSKYNPAGDSSLRQIFLKTDNYIKGRYLAEITKELMTDLERNKHQHSQWSISIHGRDINEWDKLAKWVMDNKLFSHNVRWLVQMPRNFHIYKRNAFVKTFEDIIRNVFQPLFEVTKDPRTHPELHVFLQRVVGFDSVDDESNTERHTFHKVPIAKKWDFAQSPPYSYWIYYMYANLTTLNSWRHSRGFNTFVLRPHCGEAGDPEHLASAFLTSSSIAHGILLRKVPALQYLFYLKQIGIAMSPLSNNSLFLTYERNPFPDFFKAGLNVSLSTDDPLIFHFTKEPLLEEYSVAAHIYKLSQSSLAELARNSVIQSGFEMEVKRHWLGEKWYLPGSAGNDINRTNVPDIRLDFRHRLLMKELNVIRSDEIDNLLS